MEFRDRQTDSPQKAAGQFASTHWSLVLAAGQRGSAESEEALRRLCESYWTPLYAYILRRVPDPHDAHDLTQAFFERLLDREYLNQADPQRGRFRAFLLTAFQHFLSKEWDKAKTRKRGGGWQRISFEVVTQDSSLSADQLDPEKLFEREWAITLLEKVMERLRREMEQSGKGLQFESLKPILSGGRTDATYIDAAAALGVSLPAVRMAASRLRNRYRELLRDEIAQTVTSTDDIEDEIRSLFAAFEP